MTRRPFAGRFSLAVAILSAAPAWGQLVDLKGQQWSIVTLGNDPAPGTAGHEEFIGYIPTLSLVHELNRLSILDLEWAYRGGMLINGGSERNVHWFGRQHRLWVRYAAERLDLRLGLQKIAFGPGQLLRPLAWFDTFDLRDPTGQTEGVTAIRLQYFLGPRLVVWGWGIRPDVPDSLSVGGRVEYTFGASEVALTFHRHQPTRLDYTGPPLLFSGNKEERYGLDLRWDGPIGLWTEMVSARAVAAPVGPLDRMELAMFGGDYTLPVGKGLYVMAEHLWSRSTMGDLQTEAQVSMAMASYPFGMLDRLLLVVVYSRRQKSLYRFLQWQRTYDNFILTLIGFVNPERSIDAATAFGAQGGVSGQSLASTGRGMQFMIIYNH